MTQKQYFSLIELLIVIAVISILMSILLPALRKAKNLALDSQCKSNMKQCGLALAGYSNDFDDWTIAGYSSQPGAVYPTLGTMMMGIEYISATGNFSTPLPATLDAQLNFGTVFQCPVLPPPKNYKQRGKTYPFNGYNSNTEQSYGLKYMDNVWYFAGEKTPPSPLTGLVKYSSLYQPSRLPFMVDSMLTVSDSGGNLAGNVQLATWYMVDNTWAPGITGPAGVLHLRHNRKGNVWCPDGHVAGWKASDTTEFKRAYNGVENPSYLIGYHY